MIHFVGLELARCRMESSLRARMACGAQQAEAHDSDQISSLSESLSSQLPKTILFAERVVARVHPVRHRRAGAVVPCQHSSRARLRTH